LAAGNITKRAAASGQGSGTSECNCASSPASSCNKTEARQSSVATIPVRAPVPNDSCYGACCPGVQPFMKDDSPKPQFDVEFYGYGDMEIVQHPLGPCICYAGRGGMIGCARSGLGRNEAEKKNRAQRAKIVLAEN
jgi:hypothetical protein